MKKKDFVVIGLALIMALGIYILFRTGVLARIGPIVQSGESDAGVTLTLVPQENAGATRRIPTFLPSDGREPGEAYVMVTVSRRAYAPVPLQGQYTLSIDQPGAQNVVRVADGVVSMHSATCKNQRCVGQGQVSLDNRDARALYNQIICTPNQVVLDVLTLQEVKALYGE